MDKHFESKHTMMRASSDVAKSLVMLNRKIWWQDNGIAKILEKLAEALNLLHAKLELQGRGQAGHPVRCEGVLQVHVEPKSQ